MAVGMHPAAKAGEVVFGVLALTITGEPIPGGGLGLPALGGGRLSGHPACAGPDPQIYTSRIC
jgi:hypothetical protein